MTDTKVAYLDSRLYADPRILDVGLAGFGLYVAASLYCTLHDTEGFVPARVLDYLTDGNADLFPVLEGYDLVHRVGSDYWLPEFLGGGQA